MKGKNSIGNGEAKDLICIIHGYEVRWGRMQEGGGVQVRGG